MTSRALAGPFHEKDRRTYSGKYTNIEVALEQGCRILPHGGDHET
jgi:hypothetical protein